MTELVKVGEVSAPPQRCECKGCPGERAYEELMRARFRAGQLFAMLTDVRLAGQRLQRSELITLTVAAFGAGWCGICALSDFRGGKWVWGALLLACVVSNVVSFRRAWRHLACED